MTKYAPRFSVCSVCSVFSVFSVTTITILLLSIILSLSLPATAALAYGPSIPETETTTGLQPLVRVATRHDVSPPLRMLTPIPPRPGVGLREIPTLPLPRPGDAPGGERPLSFRDPVLQEQMGVLNMPAPLQNFEGVNNVNGVHPPDTQGDVGPNHYVQWVNISFAIWDKEGNLLYGPVNGNTLWQGFGGPCETTNDGDPITLYDHLADRWLMSQFALPNFPDGPFYQCIAISQTPDPTGPWYRYEFVASNTKMNDYPHFGVWPDGYYMTVNQFSEGSLNWAGAGVFAFERDAMLQGNAAQMVYFDLYGVNSMFGGMLPSDLDGSTLPPTGAPNYFAEVDDGSPDAMRLWAFHVDWNTPANSTFGISGQPNAVLPVAPFTQLCPYTRNCIPQPGTSQKLDAIGDRLMYRLAYRNFGDHESLVLNHTVDAGSGRAGVRWYEVRDPGGTPVIYQQGTYAPSDGLHRWMGSIAMDRMGNIALGYSVSSSSVYPSIRYTGRLAGDPLGTMSQGEAEIIAGSGSQTSSYARWGDYSMMGIDPLDDCTFWYTQEYIQTTGYANWQTRIAAFQFPGCSAATEGTLTGTVYDATGTPVSDPIAGATVWASRSPTETTRTTSGPDGAYTLVLSAGTYTVTTSAYGYLTGEIAGVSVSPGMTTTQNIPLTPAPRYVVSGTVTDATTGWPLYARIAIEGYPGAPVWSDPVTGFYSVTLAAGRPYTFSAQAWAAGYRTAERVVAPLTADRTEHLTLPADPASCIAPGYDQVGGTCRPTPGGLVVGHTRDQNTAIALDGVTIVNDAGYSAVSAPTLDGDTDDGFYTLFAPAGAAVMTATHDHYGPAVFTATVVQSDTVRRDVSLPAALLSYTPERLAATLDWGTYLTLPLTVTNMGGVTASFSLVELSPALSRPDLFQSPMAIVKPFKQNFSTTLRLKMGTPPSWPLYPAGQVLDSWPAGSETIWGLAPVGDPNDGGRIWVASPTASWSGRGRIEEYTLDGTPTGRFHSFTWQPRFGPADLAFDPHTGRIWAMNIDSPGRANCIYEIDPAAGYTGRRVCPQGSGFANSQRGLAYDPVTSTWFAGGWNDGTITRFASDGRLLARVSVGLAVAGLAYNPDTHHLFVMVNADPSRVYVLDVAADYAPVGQFDVGAGLGAYGGAGLELDCAGHLWAVDASDNTIYRFDSGEATTACQADVSWLSTSPVSGTLGPGSTRRITVAFDAAALGIPDWGTHTARLKVEQDTPYLLADLPVTMTVTPPPPTFTIAAQPAEDPAGSGSALRYTLVVTNSGGPATGMIISNTLPANTQFVQAGQGGTLTGNDVVWGGLSLGYGQTLTVTFDVLVACVPSGTLVVNETYMVKAAERPSPTWGLPVSTPAVTRLPQAAFTYITPLLRNWPVTFTNLSQYSAYFVWDFGDGVTSTLPAPTHVYAQVGAYPVSLRAANLCASDITTQTATVEDYALRVYPQTASAAVEPGGTVTYTVHITNVGTLTDRATFTVDGSLWGMAPSSGTIGALAVGEAATLLLNVTAPADALAGEMDPATLTVAMESDPRTPPASTVALLTTTVRPVYDVTFSPAAIHKSGHADNVVAYVLYVHNTGNVSDTYTLGRLSGAWDAVMTPSGPFTLVPGGQEDVHVSITVPPTVTTYDRDVTVIQVVGGGGATALGTLTTTVACDAVQGASFVYVPPSPVGTGQVITFTGDAWGGTPPFTFTWTFGDGDVALGRVVTHTYAAAGDYLVEMWASNCGGANRQRAAHGVTVQAVPNIRVQPPSLDVAVPVGQTAGSGFNIQNTGSDDLEWSLSVVPPVDWLEVSATAGTVSPAGTEPIAVTFEAATGSLVGSVYTTTLRVLSDDPDRPVVSLPVAMMVTAVCTPLQSVSISGPTVVVSGTEAAYHVVYAPADATGVGLRWDDGRWGPDAAYTWRTAGGYVVAVTATASCGEPVTDTLSVVVMATAPRRVYLPLVMR